MQQSAAGPAPGQTDLHMGQIALFKLLEHRQGSFLVELSQSINGPFIQVSVGHQP